MPRTLRTCGASVRPARVRSRCPKTPPSIARSTRSRRIKEQPTATPEQVARAELALTTARHGQRRVSEAARLSRLYWWTAEYGLVGTPADYKLYGAGLLSSLWESFACHDPKVSKPPLTASAGEVDYDVTHVRSPSCSSPVASRRCTDVLDEGRARAAIGSRAGKSRARRSRVGARSRDHHCSAGPAELCGVVSRRVVSDGKTTLFALAGRTRVALNGARVEAEGAHVILGDSRAALEHLVPGRIDIGLAHGVRVRGELLRVLREPNGAAAILVMASGALNAGVALEASLSAGDLVVLADAALGAHAGAPSDFFAETELPQTLVPKAHTVPPREHDLLGLYETAIGALRSAFGAEVVPVFERVHVELARHYADDWLLRWNLLESLQKLSLKVELAAELRRELEELEERYQYRQPAIASGLSYLARVARNG